jgi:hypothetical protein
MTPLALKRRLVNWIIGWDSKAAVAEFDRQCAALDERARIRRAVEMLFADKERPLADSTREGYLKDLRLIVSEGTPPPPLPPPSSVPRVYEEKGIGGGRRRRP